MKKKIFILLPDGVGLRNFAYTNFHKKGTDREFDIVFWNTTLFNLSEMGFDEIKIENPKLHPLTDLFKKAQIQIELNLNIKRANDTIYNSYRFPFSTKNFNQHVKTIILKRIIFFYNSKKGLKKIKEKIKTNERKTKLYYDSLEVLKQHKPDMVFCTNQRITSAVSQILAAQYLGIPTASFIFSWDNLPKGTKIIDTDYYFVWSEHMKNELFYYYPEIKENQVFITGTPQFEPHFESDLIQSKEVFFGRNNLNLNKKYICFSGDDETTSPNDQYYLQDVAKAIKKLNEKGYNLGIIFRRCPVDFSNRYEEILTEFKDEITCVNPEWKNINQVWNSILPLKEDISLLMNTIYHTEAVINLGSSMVFDFAAFNKPCAYINYDILNEKFPNWSVKNIYKFIHFKSMPSKDSVYWFNNSIEIEEKIELMLCNQNNQVVTYAKQWFEKINLNPSEYASERIWDAIEKIIQNRHD